MKKNIKRIMVIAAMLIFAFAFTGCSSDNVDQGALKQDLENKYGQTDKDKDKTEDKKEDDKKEEQPSDKQEEAKPEERPAEKPADKNENQGGNAGGNQTVKPEEKPIVHQHTWKDIYKTIQETYTETIDVQVPYTEKVQTGTKHHDAVTEQRWVSKPETKEVVNCACGQKFNNGTEWSEHKAYINVLYSLGQISDPGRHNSSSGVNTIDNGYYETVTIQGAYDEPIYENVTKYRTEQQQQTKTRDKQVLDHTECTGCGARK